MAQLVPGVEEWKEKIVISAQTDCSNEDWAGVICFKPKSSASEALSTDQVSHSTSLVTIAACVGVAVCALVAIVAYSYKRLRRVPSKTEDIPDV